MLQHDRGAVRRPHRRRGVHEPDDHRRLATTSSAPPRSRATWSRATACRDALGPDGLRRERGRGLPRPLGHHARERVRSDDAEGRRRDPPHHRRAVRASRASCIEDNRDKVEAMAKALLEWETIDADQIDDIMAGKPPRPPKPTRAPQTPSKPRAATPPARRAAHPRGLTPTACDERGCGPVSRERPILADGALPRSTSTRPLVMGIVNVTPDSFSDGGRFLDPQARDRACAPAGRRGRGHPRHRRRIEPPGRRAGRRRGGAARACCRCSRRLRRLGVPVSVDTRKPEVMRAALAAGADDDQRHPGAAARPARSRRSPQAGCAVCLMHMQGEPATMQQRARTTTTSCAEVKAFLRDAVQAGEARGHRARAHRVDPGFGFGKTAAHNLELLRAPARARARWACRCWRACRASRRSASSPAGRSTSASPAASRRRCSRCRAARRIRARARREGNAATCIAVWQAVRNAAIRRMTPAMSTQIFRHRRRARHGRQPARSRRTSCCAWATRRARCSRGRSRASGRS